MLILRFIILFWFTTRIGLHAFMLKILLIFLILSSEAALPLSLTQCFPLQIIQSALIGELTHTWASTDVLSFQLIFYHKYSWTMSWSHEVKGGTTDRAFSEQCFLSERGGGHFGRFNFQDLQESVQHIEMRGKTTTYISCKAQSGVWLLSQGLKEGLG